MGDMADYLREQEMLNELYEYAQIDNDEELNASVTDSCDIYYNSSRRKLMAPRIKKQSSRTKKPILIKVGKHFINPSDIRCITQVRKDLFVVKFISEPNPEWACWVNKDDIGKLLEHFEIIVSDDGE